MPEHFKYRAVGADGKIEKGTMRAESSVHVLDFLSEQQLTPVKVTQLPRKKNLSFFGFFKKVDYESLILFTNSLNTMIHAGIPLLRALRLIKIGPHNGKFNKAINQIRISLQSGKSLSESMSEFEGFFGKVYISCVAAGEESGQLENILEELARMLEEEMELTRQIKAGIRYPLMVIAAIGIAFIVIMAFVIPSFMSFYSSFGAELPLPTRIMLQTSKIVTAYWYILIAIAAIVIAVFRKFVSKPEGKLWVDEKILKIPIMGDLIIKGNVARFCLMFRILFKAGLPIVKTIDILTDSVKNSQIEKEINHLGTFMKEGRDMEQIHKEFDYFPEISLQMIAIGMESGSLEKMLKEVGTHFTKEVQYTSRQLTSILEPILTFVLGGFVLLMALAILLPMWNLIKVFKG